MSVEQGTLFDLPRWDQQASEAAKEQGMGAAADSRADLLSIARQIAVELARKHFAKETDADQVGQELERRGYSVEELGPAAGSVFRGSEWVFTGKRVKSTRISNHARELKVWKHIGEIR